MTGATHPPQPVDWAPYKAKAADYESLEGWMYRVACYVVNCDLEQARAVAQIALALSAERRCVWHAVWIFHGRRGECPCAACQRPSRVTP
ncbi:hypothetical protein LCGC14_2156970 [marine sediment metagenome]|uniref:Uncharacterized protein n=1 Tax=marine sediment metagenome TaxID=412755 RepID=A0A0F9G6U0_9ZZZZ